MRRSLTLKLLIAFLFVGLAGTVLTAVVVGPGTFREFERFITNAAPGHTHPLPQVNRNPNRIPFSRFPQGTPEGNFEARFGRLLVLGTGGAALLAFLLGIFLSRTMTRPLQELTEATSRLSRGDLGLQVPVRSQDEIGRLAASFNRMSADLARATRLRRQMTADVAHDLRTPLSIIAGYSEALHDGKLQGSPEIYAVLNQQVDHLKHLVEDLRTLSLADAGELPLNRRPVDPRALLERTALAYFAQAEAQGITLTVEAPDDLEAVSVDVERFAQVLNNLVGNALRHTPGGGTIALQAAPGRLVVRDTGEGIPADEIPHIFDRFYRGDKARRRSGGESGLGLAIAKSIVEAHGGKITVDSPGTGQGTTFAIDLAG